MDPGPDPAIWFQTHAITTASWPNNYIIIWEVGRESIWEGKGCNQLGVITPATIFLIRNSHSCASRDFFLSLKTTPVRLWPPDSEYPPNKSKAIRKDDIKSSPGPDLFSRFAFLKSSWVCVVVAHGLDGSGRIGRRKYLWAPEGNWERVFNFARLQSCHLKPDSAGVTTQLCPQASPLEVLPPPLIRVKQNILSSKNAELQLIQVE